jgi:4-amino-4-deoxy-L-arabinose transferase-like glycosyltransferase
VSSSSRLSSVVLVLLVIAYMLPGLIGHDPWKPDEPYTFGAVLHMVRTGEWVVPVVGGQPFVEKPPLYYWMSWATARGASAWLPLHDAARLASLVFVLVSVVAVAAASWLCWGEGAAGLAALLFFATLGLESHAQRMQVDLAMMAGFSLAVLGFAACIRERKWGGITLGLGIGVGFLGKGLFAPAVIGVCALLLPLFFSQWRSRGYVKHLAVAAAVALPFLVVWPLALLGHSRALFNEWLWDNNLGRFAGFTTRLGATAVQGEFGQALAWFLFPVWAYVVGGVVREGRRAWHHPALQIGLTMALVACLVLVTSASFRAIYLLPLLPPLALAGVVALRTPEGAFEKALGWFAMIGATAMAVFVWTVWAMLAATGAIPEWKALTTYFPLPFEMPVSIPAVACALALTMGFYALIVVRRRLPAPSLTLWVAALALGWGLVHTLWLPWLEHAKGYRVILGEVARRLPPNVGCIVMDGPGESERAMVEYFVGVTPRHRFVREEDCGATLWMANAEKVNRPDWDGMWRRVWGGSRPGDKVERFELFLRGPPP